MSTFLKPLAVLLISILIFGGIAFLADKDFLDFIQTRFYNPSIVKSYIAENAKDADLVQNFIFELQDKFAQTLNEPAVRSSFLYNQSAEDIFERSRIYGLLMETTSGLQSVQFVDANGIRMHFSTSTRDIITRTAASTSYRNYIEDPLALPYETISVLVNETPKITMDESGERIIFSYPFNDAMDVYHGTALFYVSSRAIAEKLVSEGRLKVNETVSVIESPPGVLFGLPDSFKAELQSNVSKVWNNGIKDRIAIDSEDSGIKFSLISLRADSGIFFGRLVNDDLFSISDSMKIILYSSMFFTFYLALYFIINFKPTPVIIVRNRIRRLRDTLFDQLYEDKSTEEKIKWLLELEQRRDEVKFELKYKLKLSAKTEKFIDGIIDKSWDEIIAIVRASSGHAALALKLSSLDVKDIVQKAQEASSEASVGDVEEIEEIGEVEEIEEVEELAEEVEEIEELADEAEEIEEIEELADEAEEIEEIDEIEEVEEIGDIEEITEVETLTVEAAPSKGLLQLASEFEIYEEISDAPVSAPSKGLLKLASDKYAEPAPEVYSGRGLLARAISEIRLSESETKTVSSRKGLLAIASEIEFSSVTIDDSENIDDIDNIDDKIDEIIKMDIVSPFVSMFSSLE